MSTMTENTETYNGWKNYETWCVNLWLGNDQGLYSATLEIVAQGLTYADDHPNVPSIWTQGQANRFAVADAIRTWVRDDLAPVGSALDNVDWDEIADAWIETAGEQD